MKAAELIECVAGMETAERAELFRLLCQGLGILDQIATLTPTDWTRPVNPLDYDPYAPPRPLRSPFTTSSDPMTWAGYNR